MHKEESGQEIVEAEPVDDPKPTDRVVNEAIEYYRPPRLGIVHLLIWITLAAVLMKVMTALIATSEPSGLAPDRVSVAHKAIWYLTSCMIAATLLGTFVIARDKIRGAAGRLQAGHWLVLVISSTWLAHCAANVAGLMLQDGPGQQDRPL